VAVQKLRETTQEKGKQMPKLKSKSGAKKRFSFTATGKVRANQANKQHGMIKRTKKQIRNQRGTTILADQDAKIIRKYLYP
jgi:large subunit ribosomal protein L35